MPDLPTSPADVPVEDTGVRYYPHKVQELFHENPCGARWFCAGYGTGKTTAAVMEAFVNAVYRHPGYQGIVAAPTYKLLHQGWLAEWIRCIPSAWWEHKGGANEHLRVRSCTGEWSVIYLRSTSDPASNEAINAAWLVYDEAPRGKLVESYQVLLGRLRRGYPGRQLGVVLTGAPQTRSHWTAIEFGVGPDAQRPGNDQMWGNQDNAVIRARTSDNPYLPVDYEAKMRRRPTSTAQWCMQFLDAQFGTIAGQIYPMFDRKIHVIPHAAIAAMKWVHVRSGKDWGYAHPGVLSTVSQNRLGDLYITAEDVHQKMIMADVEGGWIPLIADRVTNDRVETIHYDPARPEHAKALSLGLRQPGRRHAQVYPANNAVQDGIRRVQTALERALLPAKDRFYAGGILPALFVSDRCVKTIAEFESYAHIENKDGSFKEEPIKVGDDCMDALRYVIGAYTRLLRVP